REIVAPADVGAHLGEYNVTPAFLMESYSPHLASFSSTYDAKVSDRGMHLLVAPASSPIRGFTRAVFLAVMDSLFADASAQRIVVEPDVRNEKIRALNRYAGFEELKEIEIPATPTSPGKRAMLSVCSRSAYLKSRALRLAR
ncbi:MAG: GNAT family N-acetyltransferase, partial [Myxococcota bacterium]